MIDGIKITCTGVEAQQWASNKALDFGAWVSHTTGEVGNRHTAKFQNLTFTISENGTCSLSGSLHKFHNQNNSNADKFTHSDICQTINRLQKQFHIIPEKAIIHNLEIGVNIALQYPPETIIRNIICHKTKPFNTLATRGEKLGIICEYQNYAIKFYNKGKQLNENFTCPKGQNVNNRKREPAAHILRYELKLHRAALLTPFGIATLADLKNLDIVGSLLALLLEKLQEIIFFDFKFRPDHLTEKEALRWQQYSNPYYWAELTKQNRTKQKAKFEALKQKYRCIDWGAYLLRRTTEEWAQLLNAKKLPLTRVAKAKKGGKKRLPFTHFSATRQNRQGLLFTNLDNCCNWSPATNQKRKNKNTPCKGKNQYQIYQPRPPPKEKNKHCLWATIIFLNSLFLPFVFPFH